MGLIIVLVFFRAVYNIDDHGLHTRPIPHLLQAIARRIHPRNEARSRRPTNSFLQALIAGIDRTNPGSKKKKGEFLRFEAFPTYSTTFPFFSLLHTTAFELAFFFSSKALCSAREICKPPRFGTRPHSASLATKISPAELCDPRRLETSAGWYI